MEIIKEGSLNALIPERGYLLKDKGDNGQTLEDGTFVPPYLTDKIYLPKSIITIEQCEEIYEEVPITYVDDVEDNEEIAI